MALAWLRKIKQPEFQTGSQAKQQMDGAEVSAERYSFNTGIMRVAPAVVSVYASEPTSIIDSSESSQGSGVIVAAAGIILTNLHLIENFGVIDVVLNDGRTYPGNADRQRHRNRFGSGADQCVHAAVR